MLWLNVTIPMSTLIAIKGSSVRFLWNYFTASFSNLMGSPFMLLLVSRTRTTAHRSSALCSNSASCPVGPPRVGRWSSITLPSLGYGRYTGIYVSLVGVRIDRFFPGRNGHCSLLVTVIVLSTSVGRLVDGVFVRSVCAVVYSVRGAILLCPTLFSFAVGEQVQMPLIAVGILHVVATKKGRDHSCPFGLWGRLL